MTNRLATQLGGIQLHNAHPDMSGLVGLDLFDELVLLLSFSGFLSDSCPTKYWPAGFALQYKPASGPLKYLINLLTVTASPGLQDCLAGRRAHPDRPPALSPTARPHRASAAAGPEAEAQAPGSLGTARQAARLARSESGPAWATTEAAQ